MHSHPLTDPSINTPTQPLQTRSIRLWLIGLFSGLAALHLNLTSHLGEPGLSSSSLLFWTAAALLGWNEQHKRDLSSSVVSSLVGISLLGIVLYKSLHLFEGDFFLRLSPLLSLLGWGLIASGFKGLKQYKKEIFLLSFLAIPWEFVYLFDVSLLTAKFSAFILWLLGFEITRQGVWIFLPTGSIEVYNGCSGVKMMMQLLGISWIVLTLVPTAWKQKVILPVVAIAIGFGLNGVRVALMAVLIAMSDSAGFDYWHVGTGSLVFSAIAVLCFGLASTKILRQATKTASAHTDRKIEDRKTDRKTKTAE
ncbi:MAG: cyanoexosortase A [Cyanobacteria bacterium J06621_11]